MPAAKDSPPSPSETPPRDASRTPTEKNAAPAPQPSGPAIVFYRLVCRLARKPDPETGQPRGYAFAFCKWYAAQFGRTLRTVYEWIRQLRDAGWIETQLDEGVRVFIRPLLPVAPPRVIHTPRPKASFTKPEIAGVKAGAVAGDYPRITSETEEKQYSKAPSGDFRKRERVSQAVPTNPPAPVPDALAPVVMLMHQCGVAEGSEARYLAEIPPAALRDACEYTLRRTQKGLNGGAGYTISVARNLATGTWQFPAWYLAEIGTAERKNERETAARQRTVASRPAPPKLAIPADWLPGIPETEARTLVQDAFLAIRNGTGHAPSPYSEVVRDQARLFWQKRNPGKSVPW
ncbi:MAG: hypothetical protein H7145_07785 [Akkermansiaceae bacterium]|nr:hypothetical protein [Armatimonadota bacterium]